MLQSDRLISTQSNASEEAIDRAIRPLRLAEYIGQDSVSSQMQIFIEAAKNLYRDYLKYKDRSSRQNSIDSTTFSPYNSNIKLPSPNNMDIQKEENQKKKGRRRGSKDSQGE